MRLILKSLVIILAVGLVIMLRQSSKGRSRVADSIVGTLSSKAAIEEKLKNSSFMQHTKVELIEQNDRLHQDNQKLKIENRQLEDLLKENAELRSILKMSAHAKHDCVTAQIISKDPAVSGCRVRIDRGEQDGILIGQPVLANDSLYGRIIEVSQTSALVMTIFDPNFKIGVEIIGPLVQGVLSGLKSEQWNSEPRCIVRYLPRDLEYREGMVVVTSSFGKLVPGLIPVGVLTLNHAGRIVDVIDDLYKTSYVLPKVTGSSFNHVLVIINR